MRSPVVSMYRDSLLAAIDSSSPSRRILYTMASRPVLAHRISTRFSSVPFVVLTVSTGSGGAAGRAGGSDPVTDDTDSRIAFITPSSVEVSSPWNLRLLSIGERELPSFSHRSLLRIKLCLNPLPDPTSIDSLSMLTVFPNISSGIPSSAVSFCHSIHSPFSSLKI